MCFSTLDESWSGWRLVDRTHVERFDVCMCVCVCVCVCVCLKVGNYHVHVTALEYLTLFNACMQMYSDTTTRRYADLYASICNLHAISSSSATA
jgi:hypothetical protein